MRDVRDDGVELSHLQGRQVQRAAMYLRGGLIRRRKEHKLLNLREQVLQLFVDLEQLHLV